jgi:homoserine O-acetyltransferase/O-succinyltransferase
MHDQASQEPLKVQEQDFFIKNFQFRSGEALQELRIHYKTLGAPRQDSAGCTENAVMLLHPTGGNSQQFLTSRLVESLFAPGAPLDMERHYIIIPDSIGHGRSSRPSEGLRANFPAYDYRDHVETQRLLLAEELGINQLRLLLGVSMGGMHCFQWGITHPGFARALMPIACLPAPIAGLNRVHRKLMIDGIRSDPEWLEGNYQTQPERALRLAVSLSAMVVDNPQALMKDLPTRDAADKWARDFVDNAMKLFEVNDFLFQLEASRTYDPSVDLEKITVPVNWVNFADDIVNPVALGIAGPAARRMPQARLIEMSQSDKTRGHSTWMWPEFWVAELEDLLARS